MVSMRQWFRLDSRCWSRAFQPTRQCLSQLLAMPPESSQPKDSTHVVCTDPQAPPRLPLASHPCIHDAAGDCAQVGVLIDDGKRSRHYLPDRVRTNWTKESRWHPELLLVSRSYGWRNAPIQSLLVNEGDRNLLPTPRQGSPPRTRNAAHRCNCSCSPVHQADDRWYACVLACSNAVSHRWDEHVPITDERPQGWLLGLPHFHRVDPRTERTNDEDHPESTVIEDRSVPDRLVGGIHQPSGCALRG